MFMMMIMMMIVMRMMMTMALALECLTRLTFLVSVSKLRLFSISLFVGIIILELGTGKLFNSYFEVQFILERVLQPLLWSEFNSERRGP